MTATTDATRVAPKPPILPSDETGLGAAWQGLPAAAAQAGISLDADQISQFDAYKRLLLTANERTNLTAIRDPADVERRLFLDALLMVPAIDRAMARDDSGPLPRPARLVDIGSGAGFPALVLKVVRPLLQVTLIEATGKKAAFLSHVVAELGLTGVGVIHGRAEDVARQSSHRSHYDLATARAVASLPALLELCAPFLRIGGQALFPKGITIDDELQAGQRAAPLVGVRVVAVDQLAGGQTSLVRVEKIAATPDHYPRRSGMLAHDPLGVNPDRFTTTTTRRERRAGR